MTDIESIQVYLQTGDAPGAGSDGDAYLGFAAREYYLQTSQDDLERGSRINYVFGENANVYNAPYNDPRGIRGVKAEDVDKFPIYIRFYPESRNDRWLLQRAEVRVNGDQFPVWDTATVFSLREGIWMGIRSTLFLHFLIAD